MRRWLIGVCSLVALSAVSGPAAAQEYPWCAQYGGPFSSTYNCGFVSLSQCRATISGIGGSCARNPRYAYGSERRRPDRRNHRRH